VVEIWRVVVEVEELVALDARVIYYLEYRFM
jgi:hypothetical protein